MNRLLCDCRNHLALVIGRDAAKIVALNSWLERDIIGETQSLEEVKAFVEARVPRMPEVTDKQDWEARGRKDSPRCLCQTSYFVAQRPSGGMLN